MGKNFCKYLGGFLEVSLVSWRVMIARFYFWINLYIQGRDVLRVAMFQDIREAKVEVYVRL